MVFNYSILIGLSTYCTAQFISKQDELSDFIQEVNKPLKQNKSLLYDKYGKSLQLSIEQGDGPYSDHIPELKDLLKQKLEHQKQFLPTIGLLLMSGFSLPLISKRSKNQIWIIYWKWIFIPKILKSSKMILLFIVRTFAYNSFRIDLNLEFPITGGQYLLIQTNYTNSVKKSDITAYYAVSSYLKQSSFGYQSQMFDTIIIPQIQSSQLSQYEVLRCYQNNVQILKQISSCTQICQFNNLTKLITAQAGFQANIKNTSYYIIDNTQFPCENGTYFQLIQPWISLQAAYTIDNTNFIIERLSVIVLLVITLIEIMACVVLYYKLRKLKSKIRRRTERTNTVNKFPFIEQTKSFRESQQEMQYFDDTQSRR
ncbi:hypothetical protein pb186bvf_011696 [Paramecium bursaria]